MADSGCRTSPKRDEHAPVHALHPSMYMYIYIYIWVVVKIMVPVWASQILGAVS